jgi:hypothetical protein
VKRLAAALAGIAGIAWLKRRHGAQPDVDPAADLRAKLAEARDAGDDREAFEAGEKPVDEVEAAGSAGGAAADARPEDPTAGGGRGDVRARRSDVHDRARAAMDELSSDD